MYHNGTVQPSDLPVFRYRGRKLTLKNSTRRCPIFSHIESHTPTNILNPAATEQHSLQPSHFHYQRRKGLNLTTLTNFSPSILIHQIAHC